MSLFCLRIDDRFVHALHRRLEIDDLAFAHAARRRLTDAENLDRAVGPSFADHDANFRGSNFETDHQIAACHYAYPFCSTLNWNCLAHRRSRTALCVVGFTGAGVNRFRANRMQPGVAFRILRLRAFRIDRFVDHLGGGFCVKVTGMFRCTSRLTVSSSRFESSE